MKRFRFTLQPVLEHRKRIEDEKQQVFAERRRDLDAAEAELRRLNDEFKANSDLLRSSHNELDGDALRRHYAHGQFLDRCIVAQITIVAERRVALDRARSELLEATKERKVVDKLKERRYEAHLASERTIEQNELDDGNARRYGRAAGGQP
ncbi:MAG: flagellar export protein FliJ [bacterium]|nr:flagellar export protein FliJ [bacterium]